MPSKKPQLINNENYHIILRGVGDQEIFKDINDYYRGIFSIYEFNNKKLTEIRLRRAKRKKEKNYGGQTPDNRELFVEILAFCFMPNHIHLLLKQIKNNGISHFMQKLGTGYATYFNKKHKRKGHLFNKFKAVHIEDDNQMITVFSYIHMNPASLIEPGWKENGIKNGKRVMKFLENYKWSSCQDYFGNKNFPSVIKKDFFLELLNGENGCKEIISKWVENKKLTGVRPQ